MYLNACPAISIASSCTSGDGQGQLGAAVLRDLTLSNCEATGDYDGRGGGICLDYPQEGHSIRSCEFTSCTANASSEGGGALTVGLRSDFNQYATIFEYCFFRKNNRAITNQGHDLYIRNSGRDYFTTAANRGPFNKATCSTRTPETKPNHYCSCDGNEADGWLDEDDRIYEPDVYVHPESINEDSGKCGFTNDSTGACANLEVALLTERLQQGKLIILLGGIHTKQKSQLLIADNFFNKVSIKGVATEENNSIALHFDNLFSQEPWIQLDSSNTAGLSLQNVNLSILGSSSTTTHSHGNEPDAATFENVLFEIAGNLEFQSVTISSQSTDITCSHSIIKLTSGSISMTAVKFESFTLINSPLISWMGGEITLDGSNPLTLSKMKFENCKAESGKGGAIYLDIGNSDNYLLTDLSFGTGDFANSAESGNNIYLSTSKLESLASAQIHLSIEANDKSDFLYTDTSNSSNIINEHLNTNSERKIEISDSNHYINPSSWSNTQLTIQVSNGQAPTIECGSADQFPTSAAVSLSSLIFEWSTSITATLFDRTGGTLTLSSCTLNLPASSSHSLFSLGGTSNAVLLLTSVTIKRASGMTQMSKPLITLTSNAQLTIADGEFSNISLNEGNGAVVSNNNSISTPHTISISGTSFDGCVAPNGDGGALHITLSSSTKLTIGNELDNNLIFKNCQALPLTSEQSNDESTEGHGGAICIQVEDGFTVSSESGNVNPLIQNVQFGKEEEKNEASVGPDIFVSGAFQKLVSSTNFPVLDQWVKDPTTNPPQYNEGWDTQAMGYKQGASDSPIPLLTLRYEEDKKKESLAAGAVAGISIGAVFVVALIILVVVLLVLWKTHKGCFKRKVQAVEDEEMRKEDTEAQEIDSQETKEEEEKAEEEAGSKEDETQEQAPPEELAQEEHTGEQVAQLLSQ